MALTYKKTGVDISGIKSTHKGIGRIISSTHDKSVRHGFGHYAGIVRAQGRDIAVHTDGVGTKVLIAGMMKKYDTIGIDCMGMNVNDMICTGATPVAFVDYIAANRNDSTAKVIPTVKNFYLPLRNSLGVISRPAMNKITSQSHRAAASLHQSAKAVFHHI